MDQLLELFAEPFHDFVFFTPSFYVGKKYQNLEILFVMMMIMMMRIWFSHG